MTVNVKHYRQHHRQNWRVRGRRQHRRVRGRRQHWRVRGRRDRRQHWRVRGRRGRRQGGLPGPLKVDVPMFLVLTTTTLPGPLAAARGEVRGT